MNGDRFRAASDAAITDAAFGYFIDEAAIEGLVDRQARDHAAPLDAIVNLAAIDGVAVRGVWLDRAIDAAHAPPTRADAIAPDCCPLRGQQITVATCPDRHEIRHTRIGSRKKVANLFRRGETAHDTRSYTPSQRVEVRETNDRAHALSEVRVRILSAR